MILKLKDYPVVIDGVEYTANDPLHYGHVFKMMRWILLNESDWTMMPDSPLTDSERQDWVEWRQYLRDLPNSFPEVLGETLEINEPPAHHCPASWINLTPDAPVLHHHDDGTTHTH